LSYWAFAYVEAGVSCACGMDIIVTTFSTAGFLSFLMFLFIGIGLNMVMTYLKNAKDISLSIMGM